jgi:integrase
MPKRVPPLSPKKLAAIRPTNHTIEVVDGSVPGLRVRIHPSGTRTWSLNIRDSRGNRRRFDLGPGLGIAQARRKAEDLRRSVRDGADPTGDRRAARQRAQAARQGVGTLNELLENYFNTGPGSEQRRATKSLKMVQAVLADFLDHPALELKRSELQLAADRWRSPSSASLAVRLIRPCLKWAEKRSLVREGLAQLEQPGRPRKRDRVLTRDELNAIWQHLGGAHGDVVRWLLWTGCRLNEAAGMTWSEVHGSDWIIPASRSKNGRQRSVPLPRQASNLLQRIGGGDPGELVFPSKRGRRLDNWDRETKHLQSVSETSGWHRHDLRRTVATLLGDLGFPPHVVSVVLGHAHIAEGATAVYARSRYQREHREALQALADEIDRIVTGEKNVLRLAAAG